MNERPYQPVPVETAAQIAAKFRKSIVVVISWDEEHALLHTTSYGEGPIEKINAAALAEILASAAGGDLSKKTSFEKLAVYVAPEDLRAILLAEYGYWRESRGAAAIGAVGACANILGALLGHRAPWHPPVTPTTP